MSKQRCPWSTHSLQEQEYHDNEWGVKTTDEQRLFEMITLEGAQAGLSWATILKKREGYRTAFVDFDVAKVASFSEAKVQQLLQDSSIVRHEGKIRSVINNAQCILALHQQGSSFSEFVWGFVDHKCQQNNYQKMSDVPASTQTSKAMSKALKKLGFKFVGPTTCYAFMQASGMVNDHLVSCFRHKQLSRQ